MLDRIKDLEWQDRVAIIVGVVFFIWFLPEAFNECHWYTLRMKLLGTFGFDAIASSVVAFVVWFFLRVN